MKEKGKRVSLSDWWKVNSEVKEFYKSESLHRFHPGEVVTVEVRDPLSPFSAGVICLNEENKQGDKSCMNCVLILNKTQHQTI